MIKNVHLAIFINEYNQEPIFHDLQLFDDVIQLDQFMDYFYNNNQNVRKEFVDDIAEYLLDNREQVRKVEKKTKKRFFGRLSAYYLDDNGKMEFIELPKPKKIIVRDYKQIPDYERCVNFLCKLFEEKVKEINDRYQKTNEGPTKGAFIHFMCENFRKYSYEFSDEEIYQLAKYFMRPNKKNKDDCFTLIRTNVRRYFLQKAQEEYERRKQNEADLALAREIPVSEELEYSLDSPSTLQYDIELTKKIDDYDSLFLNHDLDEIDKYTNALKKGK